VEIQYIVGRKLYFEHVILMKKTEWSKDSTIINETTKVPRRSMKAIVMLFTNKTKTNSEEYVYPNIEKVRVTVEGVPNAVYSQGIPKQDCAKRQDDCLAPMKSVIKH
jgi:malic enzyme